MKIGTIVTATDLNPLYIEFIPIFIRAWKKVVPEADIHIILVASEIPEKYKVYQEYIKLFSPIEGLHTAFQAQCIRLLYPRDVQRKEGVIITDMDMLPLSRRYFVDSIKDVPEDTFVSYRNVLMPEQIAMCYNVAHPEIWQSVFGKDSTESMLRQWYQNQGYSGIHGGSGWCIDQLKLATYFHQWKGSKRVFSDSELKFNRLDRETNIFQHPKYLSQMIKNGILCDYHAWRPFSTHETINTMVINQLP